MTRGRENPACSITETGKRANSVRMLHSHHSPDSPPGPEAAGKSAKARMGSAASDFDHLVLDRTELRHTHAMGKPQEWQPWFQKL